MSNFTKAIVVCICMVVVVFAPHTDGATTCQTVASSLLPCKTYLTQGGSVPSDCCDGIRSLKSSANTAALRRAVCECLKTEAKSNNVNAQYASSLPSKCNVNIGYPISYTTNCSSVQ